MHCSISVFPSGNQRLGFYLSKLPSRLESNMGEIKGFGITSLYTFSRRVERKLNKSEIVTINWDTQLNGIKNGGSHTSI